MPPVRTICDHKTKSNVLKCQSLTTTDIYYFHKAFYEHKDKKSQDNFLIKHMILAPVKRRRVSPENATTSPSKCSVSYFVRTQKKTMIRVCLNSFINILHISRFRLNNLSKQYFESSTVTDRRGGFRQRVKYRKQKEDIIAFIQHFKVRESHYCRGKSMRRYLSADLNIAKMGKMYREERQGTEFEDVKLEYFRKIFNTHFNLGFGSPATDVCSTCLSLSERIKHSGGVYYGLFLGFNFIKFWYFLFSSLNDHPFPITT